MPHITIRQRDPQSDSSNACLVFDHGEEYPITISPPFSQGAEARLEWYFEQHLRFPFTRQEMAREAASPPGAQSSGLRPGLTAREQSPLRGLRTALGEGLFFQPDVFSIGLK